MFTQKITHIGTAFKQYFEIVPAFTEELKREAYRIRHSVYCEDLQFESMQPDRFEIDEYDAHSLHLLIRNIQNNTFIGCTRIICPSLNNNNRHLPLPFEKICAQTLDRSIIDPEKLPRNRVAEISRLAVLSTFRRRKNEINNSISISKEDFGDTPVPRFPYIPLGLYYGTVELARLHNIEILFMLTEERLASHFNKLGSKLEFIGAPVEHHGLRFPSMIIISHLLNNLKPIIRPLYQAVAADIKARMQTHPFRNYATYSATRSSKSIHKTNQISL